MADENARDGEAKLRAAIRKWRTLHAGAKADVDGVDVSPKCVFGVVTRDMVDDLAGEIEDIKAELAWIRRIIIVAIITAAIGTLLRLGGLA
nr:hypothetical protein [Chloroflexota bacterium]